MRNSQMSPSLLPRQTNSSVYIQKRYFMGNIMRVAIQVISSTFSASVRAFLSAFQQQAATAEAAEENPAAAPKISLKKQVSIPEALQIMNLTRDTCTRTKLQEHFDKMFANNDPKDGGSFYLQSKIYRANEVLVEQLDKYGFIPDWNTDTKAKPKAATEEKKDGEAKSN